MKQRKMEIKAREILTYNKYTRKRQTNFQMNWKIANYKWSKHIFLTVNMYIHTYPEMHK